MRFVMWLVESRDILASTAANYVGSVQGWHLRRTGVKLAAGMRLARVAEMVKGLRRLRGDPGRRVRRGVSPDVLRAQMDAMLDPRTVDGANMRAALSLGFQGLLRGAEFTVRGRQWDPARDMSRADVAELSAERAVVMMLPCKNMQHLNGKTVPLVVGGGGLFIDAPAELRNLLTVDPVYGDRATRTPLFRHADGSAITEAQVRDMIKRLMQRAGASPAEFGAHERRRRRRGVQGGGLLLMGVPDTRSRGGGLRPGRSGLTRWSPSRRARGREQHLPPHHACQARPPPSAAAAQASWPICLSRKRSAFLNSTTSSSSRPSRAMKAGERREGPLAEVV